MPLHPVIGFAEGSITAQEGIFVLIVLGPCVEVGRRDKADTTHYSVDW